MTTIRGTAVSEITITEAEIERYKQKLSESEHASATVEKYAAALHKLMEYLHGEPVTKSRLMEFRDYLKEDHTAQSVNGFLSAINKYLDLNQMSDLKLKLLKVQKSVFRPKEKELAKAEYERLIATAKELGKDRLALLIETIGGTGIRVGEVRYITVEAVRQGKVEIALKGKIRVIPLTGKLQKKLLHYAKEKGIKSGEIFITKNGTSLSRKQIWEQMKSICEKAGVESSKVFPHNLRHLFARCYYRITQDIVKLADMLGHSSIETTRIYLKASIDEHTKTLEKLGLVS